MAELADALDSGSNSRLGSGGSTPPFGIFVEHSFIGVRDVSQEG